MKFRLFNFLGVATANFFVTDSDVSASPTTAISNPSHFIFVADASGSMWGDMDALKASIEKVLTLQEYKDSDVSASLVSFSSQGDVVTHFDHVSVREIMAPNSPQIQAIRRLSTRGLTCISQGLATANKLVRDGEITAVVLLSDGYANDRSPGAEKREIDALVDTLAAKKNVFVNTIALRSWADYKLLAYIANACSGVCHSIPSAKEVFDHIHSTVATVAGKMTPAIEIPIGEAQYQVALSTSARKVIGGNGDLTVRGLSSDADVTVFRFRQVSDAEYAASTDREVYDPTMLLAFARTKLAEGEINTAKYALGTLRAAGLLDRHSRSLTNPEIAAMAAEIETYLFDGVPANETFNANFGIPNANAPSVLSILTALSGDAFNVDYKDLAARYQRRGVKRLEGERSEDGTVVKPWVRTASRGDGTWLRSTGVTLNRANATANMKLVRPISLVNGESGDVISKVAGVDVSNLTTFNDYTIVGDGSLNVDRLRVKLSSLRQYRRLEKLGVVTGGYSPETVYEIDFTGRPMIGFDAKFDAASFDGAFNKIARAATLSKILRACVKGESADLTPEQVAELKRHCLTPSLNVSLPTTTPYTDRNQALADGIIDTRVTYSVDFGSFDVVNVGDLYSANEFLARHYTVTGTDKPKLTDVVNGGVVGRKVLSARTKINAVDNLMKPIFDSFLGLDTHAAVNAVFMDFGLDTPNGLWAVDRADRIEAYIDAADRLDQVVDDFYADVISPVVFYIGSTGLIPDDFGVKPESADAIKVSCPNLSVGKALADAMFYRVGNTLLTVSMGTADFSTDKT